MRIWQNILLLMEKMPIPGKKRSTRLNRITPLEVINPEIPEHYETLLKNEMERAWERDWSDL